MYSFCSLEDFRQAYAKNGELKNILLDDGIAKTLNEINPV
jgi:6-phosphogluconate dehydrogenase